MMSLSNYTIQSPTETAQTGHRRPRACGRLYKDNLSHGLYSDSTKQGARMTNSHWLCYSLQSDSQGTVYLSLDEVSAYLACHHIWTTAYRGSSSNWFNRDNKREESPSWEWITSVHVLGHWFSGSEQNASQARLISLKPRNDECLEIPFYLTDP